MVFPSASAAVNGGMAILEAAAAPGGEPGTDAIRVGIGVHAGETAESTEGFVGSAVNIAARICAQAGPGELLVSDTVRSLTRTFLGLQFVPRGRRRLKGIAEPVLIYQVLPSTAAAGAIASGTGERWPLRRSRDVRPGRHRPIKCGACRRRARRRADRGRPLGSARFVHGRFVFGRRGLTGEGAASAGPSVSTDPNPLLNAAEEELLGRSCPPRSVSTALASTLAEGSAGAQSVSAASCLSPQALMRYGSIEFPSSRGLTGAFADALARTRASPGDCETTPLAHGLWAVPERSCGETVCYSADGAAWLEWTYDDDRILVRARRGDGDARLSTPGGCSTPLLSIGMATSYGSAERRTSVSSSHHQALVSVRSGPLVEPMTDRSVPSE